MSDKYTRGEARLNRNQFYYIVFLIWFFGGFLSMSLHPIGVLILFGPIMVILIGGFVMLAYSYYIYLGQGSNQKET